MAKSVKLRLGEIHKDVVKAAGHKAIPQPKTGPSAFKDFVRPKTSLTGKVEGSTQVGDTFRKGLKFEGVEYLIVTGRYLHACIRATIMDALEDGFKVLTASTVLRGSKASLKGEKEGWFAFAEDADVSWYGKSAASKDLATF